MTAPWLGAVVPAARKVTVCGEPVELAKPDFDLLDPRRRMEPNEREPVVTHQVSGYGRIRGTRPGRILIESKKEERWLVATATEQRRSRPSCTSAACTTPLSRPSSDGTSASSRRSPARCTVAFLIEP